MFTLFNDVLEVNNLESYSVFKLNLGPAVIKSYTKDRTNGWKQLKYDVIKSDLMDIFGNPVEYDHGEYLHFVSKNTNAKKEIIESSEYREFIQAMNQIEKEYFAVIKNYSKNDGILWPDKFLTITKPDTKQCIISLLEKYPVLNTAFDEISDDDVMGNLKGYGEYGHGRKAIIDSRKIFRYIEAKENILLGVDFFYELKSEYILISSENVSSAQVVSMSERIQAVINAAKMTNIGHVSVNMVQDGVEITKQYAQVTVNLVYPNGAKQVEERDIASRIKVNAANVKEIYKAPKGEKIDTAELAKKLEPDAKHGYLKSIMHGKTSIMKYIPMIVKKSFHN